MATLYKENIVKINDWYTTSLVNVLTPLLYEGFLSLYKDARKLDLQLQERAKVEANVRSPGVLKLFQIHLKEIPKLNNHILDTEVSRIREKSKCGEYFDDLVKAVVKSSIVLLTYKGNKRPCDLLRDRYHERVTTKDFIHKCYIECVNEIYLNPELFWHEFPTLEIKRNQRDTFEAIRRAIVEAIRKVLPMKLMLVEYLKDEYEEPEMSEGQIHNLRTFVTNDLYGGSSAIGTASNGFHEIDESVSSSDSNDMISLNERLGMLNDRVNSARSRSDRSHKSDRSRSRSRSSPRSTSEKDLTKIVDIPRAADDSEVRDILDDKNFDDGGRKDPKIDALFNELRRFSDSGSEKSRSRHSRHTPSEKSTSPRSRRSEKSHRSHHSHVSNRSLGSNRSFNEPVNDFGLSKLVFSAKPVDETEKSRFFAQYLN